MQGKELLVSAGDSNWVKILQPEGYFFVPKILFEGRVFSAYGRERSYTTKTSLGVFELEKNSLALSKKFLYAFYLVSKVEPQFVEEDYYVIKFTQFLKLSEFLRFSLKDEVLLFNRFKFNGKPILILNLRQKVIKVLKDIYDYPQKIAVDEITFNTCGMLPIMVAYFSYLVPEVGEGTINVWDLLELLYGKDIAYALGTYDNTAARHHVYYGGLRLNKEYPENWYIEMPSEILALGREFKDYVEVKIHRKSLGAVVLPRVYYSTEEVYSVTQLAQLLKTPRTTLYYLLKKYNTLLGVNFDQFKVRIGNRNFFKKDIIPVLEEVLHAYRSGEIRQLVRRSF